MSHKRSLSLTGRRDEVKNATKGIPKKWLGNSPTNNKRVRFKLGGNQLAGQWGEGGITYAWSVKSLLKRKDRIYIPPRKGFVQKAKGGGTSKIRGRTKSKGQHRGMKKGQERGGGRRKERGR